MSPEPSAPPSPFLAALDERVLVFDGALALSIALSACSPPPQGPAPIPERTGAPVRVVPGNTAAAEFVAAILGETGASRVAALPEQVDAYSSLDFRSGAWAALPRFSRYEPEPLIVLHPDLVVTHEWQGLDTTQILRAQGVPVVMLASARSYEDVRGSIATLGKAFTMSMSVCSSTVPLLTSTSRT